MDRYLSIIHPSLLPGKDDPMGLPAPLWHLDRGHPAEHAPTLWLGPGCSMSACPLLHDLGGPAPATQCQCRVLHRHSADCHDCLLLCGVRGCPPRRTHCSTTSRATAWKCEARDRVENENERAARRMSSRARVVPASRKVRSRPRRTAWKPWRAARRPREAWRLVRGAWEATGSEEVRESNSWWPRAGTKIQSSRKAVDSLEVTQYNIDLGEDDLEFSEDQPPFQ